MSSSSSSQLHSNAIQNGNSIVTSSVLTAGEVVLGFMMMALFNLLQIQSQSISPFVSHPIKEFVFIVSLLLYAISLYVVKKIQTTNSHDYLPLWGDICFFSGSVGCDLLLFILVPLLGYMAAFFCLCLFVRIIYLHHPQLILLRDVLAQGYHWLHRVSISIYSHASRSHSEGSDAAAADGGGIGGSMV